MNWLALILGVQCLIYMGLLLWSQAITKKALAFLDIETELAHVWATMLTDFSANRLNFGDTEAIRWLDAETGRAMDKIRNLLDRADQIK